MVVTAENADDACIGWLSLPARYSTSIARWRTQAAIAGACPEIYEGAPDALFVTDTERFNRDLLRFTRSQSGSMEAIYRVEGDTAHTSEFAGGPWDPKLQHGAAPSSLICWAIERLPAAVPMRVARLTVDLMRPVPVAPLTIESEVLREGRKIQLVAVRLLAQGTEVVRATALRIRRAPRDLPSTAFCPPHDMRAPEMCPEPRGSGMKHTPFLRFVSMRMARGSFVLPGPASVWYRAERPIVEGAEISPLMRAAIAADFCNGTSSVLDFRDWTFINGDLTLNLAREPVGDWILLDAETWAGPDSIGIAAARLADRDGYFGRAVQSVLFERR